MDKPERVEMEFGYDLPPGTGEVIAIRCKECGMTWASVGYFAKHPATLCCKSGSSWRDVKIDHLELIRGPGTSIVEVT